MYAYIHLVLVCAAAGGYCCCEILPGTCHAIRGHGPWLHLLHVERCVDGNEDRPRYCHSCCPRALSFTPARTMDGGRLRRKKLMVLYHPVNSNLHHSVSFFYHHRPGRRRILPHSIHQGQTNHQKHNSSSIATPGISSLTLSFSRKCSVSQSCRRPRRFTSLVGSRRCVSLLLETLADGFRVAVCPSLLLTPALFAPSPSRPR